MRWPTERDTSLPADPWVRLALTVGGGHLLEGLDIGSSDDSDAPAKLLRYQIRMSARPTPYGLFAGVALVDLGDKTDITVDNHKAMIALHYMHYNFARIHKSLRVTPAMEAGVSDRVWSLDEIAALAE